jgi:hypothetical protein
MQTGGKQNKMKQAQTNKLDSFIDQKLELIEFLKKYNIEHSESKVYRPGIADVDVVVCWKKKRLNGSKFPPPCIFEFKNSKILRFTGCEADPPIFILYKEITDWAYSKYAARQQ